MSKYDALISEARLYADAYMITDRSGYTHALLTKLADALEGKAEQENPVEWGIRNHPIEPTGYHGGCMRCDGRSDDAIHHPPSERVLELERKAQERERAAQYCGAKAEGGPCILPRGHNMGYVDIPSQHNSGKRI